jgi:hypothetical protein
VRWLPAGSHGSCGPQVIVTTTFAPKTHRKQNFQTCLLTFFLVHNLTSSMSLLSALPVELLNSIYTLLDDRKDVVSLRHTCRKLAVASLDEFDQYFKSITVTSSVAGLTRLRLLVADAGDQRLSNIMHVAIHTITAASLESLAVFMQEKYGDPSRYGQAVSMQNEHGIAKLIEHWKYVQDKDSIPYLLAYKHVRTVLISCLNRLPNLKRVSITNYPFRNMTSPEPVWNEAMDPLIVHNPHDPHNIHYPRLHAFESALSILPGLNNKAYELYLSIDAKTKQDIMCSWPITLEYPNVPYTRDPFPWHRYSPTEWLEVVERIRMLHWDIFGAKDFDVKPIIISSLRRMEMSAFEAAWDHREFLLTVEESQCTHMQIRDGKEVVDDDEWRDAYDLVCLAPGHEVVGDYEDKSWDHKPGF